MKTAAVLSFQPKIMNPNEFPPSLRLLNQRAPFRLIAIGLLLAATVVTASTEKACAQAADTEAFPGRIEAMVRADVTTEVSGIVQEIHFEAGQTVKKGDLLFTLDDTDFLLGLEEAEANVMRADALHVAAKQDFERTEALKARGSVADVQVLKAKGALALAEAVLHQTEVQLKGARADLERSVIRAPLSGVIGPSWIEIGAYAEPGSSRVMAQIVQLDPVLLSYEVPYVERLEQLDISDLTALEDLLSKVTLKIQISDTWFHPHQTRPRHAAAEVDAQTGKTTLWAEVPNPRFLLRPGMRVTVLATYDSN